MSDSSPSPAEELRTAAEKLNGDPSGWIEWVHPDLRGPLAALLDHLAGVSDYANQCGFKTAPMGQVDHALAVARVINGGGA